MVLIERATCRKCGYSWDIVDRPHKSGLCESCRATKSKTSPSNQADPCKPWQGWLDQQDRPISRGKLVLPGVRRCGHNDCCNKNHIIEIKEN